MSSGLKDRWNAMKPETRQKMSILLVFGIFIGVVALVYALTGDTKKKATVSVEAPKVITLDPKLLEKTMTVKADEQSGKIEQLQKQLDAMKQGGPVPTGQPGAMQLGTPTAPGTPVAAAGSPAGVPMTAGPQSMPAPPSGKNKKSSRPPELPPGFPPQSGMSGAGTLPPPPGATGDIAVAPQQREVIGDIEIASNPSYKEGSAGAGSRAGAASSADGDKKKADRDIFLPPSYVEATLLNGLYAPTAEGARGNPVPVLLRVRDLAQLPNDVKANLKGCFIISEGVGNLSDERAHLRLKSLSCISKGGESVIDQPVKGFVVDSDGKLGVSGTVVSKMGATITRSLIAGFFSGFGDALKQSSQYSSQYTGPLGGTTSVLTADMSQMALAGLGQGVSNAANDLGKFYLELAKQTMPVIEVGGSKRVTLVFSEGVTLKVKEFKRTVRSRKSKG